MLGGQVPTIVIGKRRILLEKLQVLAVREDKLKSETACRNPIADSFISDQVDAKKADLEG